jgi:putative transposase
VQEALHPPARLVHVLDALGVPRASWYRHRDPARSRRRPGPTPTPLPPDLIAAVTAMAVANPWYGYKRIAVMCRRSGIAVNDRQVYRILKDARLLQRRRPRTAEAHQTRKLFELLPSAPNQLWQMDVTYVHLPSAGWWYVVTVIDYYSRYLLAAHLTPSYAAHQVLHALHLATAESERIHGPMRSRPFLVTDNGSSFLAQRFRDGIAEQFAHVRIQYRTPTQLGLLERFHQTLKSEEVYWRLYDSPSHARECLAEFRQRYNHVRPHWALIPSDGGDPVTPADVFEHGVATQLPRWQPWAKVARQRLEQMLDAS